MFKIQVSIPPHLEWADMERMPDLPTLEAAEQWLTDNRAPALEQYGFQFRIVPNDELARHVPGQTPAKANPKKKNKKSQGAALDCRFCVIPGSPGLGPEVLAQLDKDWKRALNAGRRR